MGRHLFEHTQKQVKRTILTEWYNELASLNMVSEVLIKKRREHKRRLFRLLADYAAYAVEIREKEDQLGKRHIRFTKLIVFKALKRRKHYREVKKELSGIV
jgi:hypothetical protein